MVQVALTAKGVFHFVTRIAVLLSAASTLLVHAQSFQPICTTESTFTSIEGRGLYVQGGIYQKVGTASQAFMIDLSQSWDTVSPSYKELSPGRGQNFCPSGISSDGKRWIVYIGNLGMLYDTKNWTQIFQQKIQGTFALTGATDPKTDMMYIPFGYPNADGTMGTLRVNLKNGDTESDYRKFTMSHEILYATSWNPYLNSLVYVSLSGVFTYTWNGGWKQLTTTGLDTISPRGHCLVSVSGGKKMVLFGGTNKGETALSTDIYILDLAEDKWTKGPPVRPEDARRSPACASTGDQVVIWGGSTTASAGQFNCPTQQVLVFNVKTNTWENRYVAPS